MNFFDNSDAKYIKQSKQIHWSCNLF